jgi:succinyl-CoA synthetase alpha subunit
MSILVDNNTKVVVQGITGGAGSFHARQCIAYGTQIVAGCTPLRGGEVFEAKGPSDKAVQVPVFDTVAEAVERTSANTSIIFVPPLGAADAILEALDAGCRLIVCITEHIPVTDMIRVRRALEGSTATLLGPNCPGVITPGQCKLGIMPAHIHRPGKFGVVSRSGTLTYEAVGQLTALGMGQSTCVGIGGDPVKGLDFIEVLKLFNDDPQTEGVMMIGEIGGSGEEAAADWVKKNMKKPVAGFIAGTTAPPGKRMGHAGAIISGGKGTAAEKIAAMEAAGIRVAPTPADMGKTLKSML